MTISQEQMLSKLSSKSRTRVEARTKELIEEEMTLRDLRRVQHLTQERMAQILGVKQDSVSRMERRADMLLSTMNSYVETMGGKLRLIVEFPKRRPYALKLGDLADESPKRRRTKLPPKKGSSALVPKGTKRTVQNHSKARAAS